MSTLVSHHNYITTRVAKLNQATPTPTYTKDENRHPIDYTYAKFMNYPNIIIIPKNFPTPNLPPKMLSRRDDPMVSSLIS